MAELADAADLKSAGPKGLWGFESPSRHQQTTDAKGLIDSSQVDFFLGGNVTVTNNVTDRLILPLFRLVMQLLMQLFTLL